MKKILSILLLNLLCTITLAQSYDYTVVDVTTPGTLKTRMREVTSEPYIFYLKVTGNIDASDIRFLRDENLALAFLDISETTIFEYTGTNGTVSIRTTYGANELPISAFSNSYSVRGMSPLISVILPKTITSINDKAFYYCTGITEISIPNSVKTIGKNAFTGCKALKKITIPSSISYVGVTAFTMCDELTELTIEGSDTYFDSKAFFSNKKIKTINCLSATPPLFAEGAFEQLESLTAVYVPANAVAAYRVSGWGPLFYLKILASVTDAPSVMDARVKIYSSRSEIQVEGVTPGKTVSLYSVTGKQLQSKISKEEGIYFGVDKKGIYLIKVNDKIYKVINT